MNDDFDCAFIGGLCATLERLDGAPCLSCGAYVMTRNDGKNSDCVNCGKVAYILGKNTDGQEVEGFLPLAVLPDNTAIKP